MNEQQKQEFLKKAKAAIDLETDIATQKAIIEAYNDSAEKNKPQLIVKPEPEKPEELAYVNASQIPFTVAEMFFSALCIMLIIPVWLIVGEGTNSFLLGGMCSLVPLGVVILFGLNRKRKINRANEEIDHLNMGKQMSWEKAKEATVQENRRLQVRYSDNLDEWQASMNENIAQLQTHLEQTQQLLRRLYAQDFIYDKYRNLPALTSIYEYFITGRCDELTGPHGAYNMYEDEVRKDTVISQLNLVIQHLEQIRQNQYMLYQQVSLIQRQSQQIAYELSKISSYTQNIMQLSAVSAYYSALTAKNTEISANLQLMGG